MTSYKADHKRDGRPAKKQVSTVFLFLLFFAAFGLFSTFQNLIIFKSVGYFTTDPLTVAIVISIWVLLALLCALIIRYRTKKTYEEPLDKIAQGARQVAEGDFSVYIPPLHTSDKRDYLDTMISDFNRMVEELGSIETLKTDFLSNVSHEIKTPIAAIQNSAELLLSSELSDEQREQAEMILSSSKKLSTLITNILKLNKLEKQNITPTQQKYDLCAQLCDTVILFDSLLEKKKVDLGIDIEENASISCDRELLDIVWSNLLSNAIKFTEPGGQILLLQTSDEEFVTVSVTDNGCGMSPQTIEHIYDKFYQGDISHSTEGNGLGLSLVRRIIELSNGEIHVESTLGVGTKFTVRLRKEHPENANK